MDTKKLKIAGKRITAVAASAALVSSAAFAGSLADYPNNFVKDGKFMGKVVVGAAADAMDTTSAQLIIDDLKAELSGETKMYKLTATKSTGGSGDSVSVADTGKTYNYGEDVNDVRNSAFDDTDLSILADDTFNNGADDQDYTQTITLDPNTAVLEHNLRNDFESTISDHLYMPTGKVATYDLEFKSDVNIGTKQDKDFIGKTLRILGQDFTITKVGTDFSSLELIGGSNQVTLGEGDSTTVTVDGKSYEIAVQSVSSGSPDQVLLSVNGETKSVDEFDTEDIGGVTIGVTDAFPSSRDSVKGYTTLVVGGNKVKLDGSGGEVKINDRSISDMYDNYNVNSTIVTSGTSSGGNLTLSKISIEYRIDDDMILKAGDAWTDKVFNAFSLKFDGLNDVNYKEVKVEESNDRLKISGETIDGNNFNDEIAKIVDDNNVGSYIHLIGNNDDDSFIVSDFNGTESVSGGAGNYSLNTAGLFIELTTVNATNVVYKVNGGASINTVVASGADTNVSVGNYQLNVANVGGTSVTFTVNGIKLANANGFQALVGDKDNQELYRFKTYTVSSKELDTEDVLTGDVRDNIAEKNIGSKLTDLTSSDTTEDGLLTDIGGTFDSLAMANNLLVNLSAVNGVAGTASTISFSLDGSDLNADDEPGDFTDSGFSVKLGVDTTDNEFDVKSPTGGLIQTYANSGYKPDVTDSNSDVQEWVSKYGVKVTYDNKEQRSITVAVPDKQVEAMVYLAAGAASTETKTVTVSEEQKDSKVSELEADGYSVSVEEMPASNVQFDISAPVTDDVATADDAIVVGGPAVNRAAAELLGLSFPTYGEASGVMPGQAVIRYFGDRNAVLVYGWSKEDTKAAAEKLAAGGLSGDMVNVQ